MDWQEACAKDKYGFAIRTDDRYEYRVYKAGYCCRVNQKNGACDTNVPEKEWFGYIDWEPEEEADE